MLQLSTREGPLRIIEPPFLGADRSAVDDPLLTVDFLHSCRSLAIDCAGVGCDAFHACLLEQKSRDNPGGHAYAGDEQDGPGRLVLARLQALLNDPATRAAAIVARDPGYARP